MDLCIKQGMLRSVCLSLLLFSRRGRCSFFRHQRPLFQKGQNFSSGRTLRGIGPVALKHGLSHPRHKGIGAVAELGGNKREGAVPLQLDHSCLVLVRHSKVSHHLPRSVAHEHSIHDVTQAVDVHFLRDQGTRIRCVVNLLFGRSPLRIGIFCGEGTNLPCFVVLLEKNGNVIIIQHGTSIVGHDQIGRIDIIVHQTRWLIETVNRVHIGNGLCGHGHEFQFFLGIGFDRNRMNCPPRKFLHHCHTAKAKHVNDVRRTCQSFHGQCIDAVLLKNGLFHVVSQFEGFPNQSLIAAGAVLWKNDTFLLTPNIARISIRFQ
mmetsp:Transcript_19099/g.39516  ORF Transcript_19099/g.39516 Transcript_19099/m.39516 type:complete len:318 (+) Transcript_19099:1072-2025(+)